ncbi:FtsH protease activity modulator HflK [Pusillimonas sp. T2]|uniref:FtsH protease activity modulator HflK n=1 Tax=Pusillimonas sp. T2 TaxID=1548123 RepID=UPI000B94660D|nr:FtsH protease activity modulator HflK [Pusillimonas sp. T2]OXR48480.1 FtsH protease activity modulator HflK [Pusillimonas sp. T2]
MRLMSKIFNLNDPGWGRGKGGNEPPRKPDNNQGNNGGPPDLDEVWRDFNNRVGSLFGRKGRRGGGGGYQGGGGNPVQLPKGSPKLVVGGLVVLVGLWLASGFVVVQEGQVAVVTKFGKYVKTLNPGLQWHMPYPIEEHQTVNISQLRTFEVGFRGSARNKVLPESLMLTTDENIVDVQYVVQYRLMPNGAPDYLFKTVDPDESVRQAAETAMRDVVGRQPMDSVLYSARTQIAADVQRLAQEILDRYQTGIQVSTVAIQNVQPPEQVQAAFDDAVKAGQDRERQINEGNAYASRVIPEAQGQAARLVQEAEGYRVSVVSRAEGDGARFSSIEAEYAKAPEVTRERMYLSTMQSILEKSSKVFIDSESSNNMLYLPLDKIMQQAARNPDAATQSASASSASTPAAADKSATNAPGAARSGSSNPYSGGSSSSLMTSPYSR